MEEDLELQLLVEAQRKQVVGDLNVSKDYKIIAQKAAELLLNHCDLPTDVEELVDDLDSNESIGEMTPSDRAEMASLEAQAKEGDTNAMVKLANAIDIWLRDADGAASTHHYWIAQAALKGNGNAFGTLGMIFDGFDSDLAGWEDLFSEYGEDTLKEDKHVSTACYLQSIESEDWHSYAALELADLYLEFHRNIIGLVSRDFDKGMRLIEQLLQRDHECNRSVVRDIWAHQAPHWMRQYEKYAPPENDPAWNDCEYPYIFGMYYEYGCGGKVDLQAALKYYRRGAAFHHDPSIKHANSIERTLKETK